MEPNYNNNNNNNNNNDVVEIEDDPEESFSSILDQEAVMNLKNLSSCSGLFQILCFETDRISEHLYNAVCTVVSQTLHFLCYENILIAFVIIFIDCH